MGEGAFNKFYWGFFFIMIDFRLQGIDVLPDIIGYIFFASGFSLLASKSSRFEKGRSLNTIMIFLSIFQIYEKPAQQSGINFGMFGPIGFLIGIAATILSLVVVYNLFMGISEIAIMRGLVNISDEAQSRWTQYLALSLAGLFAIILIIIPPLALVYIIGLFVFSIVLTFKIMGFMRNCETALNGI